MLLLRTGPSTRNTVKKEFYVGTGSLTGPDTGINTHLGGGYTCQFPIPCPQFSTTPLLLTTHQTREGCVTWLAVTVQGGLRGTT
jgi:hypothetical protein